MSSIKGGTRRMPQWSVRSLRPSTPLRDWLFVSLMIAWVLLGVGPGPLQDAQAQSRHDDIRHIVVTRSQIAHLNAPTAVRQRGGGLARARRRTADVGS